MGEPVTSGPDPTAGDAGALLRVPPFPGAQTKAFQPLPSEPSEDAIAALIATIRSEAIVGDYWQNEPDAAAIATVDAEAAAPFLRVENPYTGEAMSGLEAVALCAFWRDLIRSNRDLAGGLGIAFWKQSALAPLLWDGARPLPFWRSLPAELPAGAVAVWGSKARAEDLAALERRAIPVVEVEDGFLRSAGLGADCIPPLSITVDRRGPYFDHRQPSELEAMLETHEIDPALLDRAARLRAAIVAAGLGKYERGRVPLPRWGGERRHLLVTGQVEDDRSVLTGGLGLTNLELLERVRADHPAAFILYKSHPDVEAGHRKGAIPAARMRDLADRIVTDLPIASLLDLADEVHVNTSLAGFEALLRQTPVTTYGVPFYAGWGLTRDLGPVPSRRKRRRTIDELVALALLVYPRYLDPVTGLPCPAEVVVDRLCTDSAPATGLLVGLRRMQGRLVKGWRRLVA
ncbi:MULTISPECIES: beta-3-deoxy-D-manno-oct-2-ulosonic acid transferase [Sphingomonas]|uniref:capsular polysaccharide export protein, LipB/KpsS family n=1 Tax=Sphingomonas TaxID=13687 RepID=UPI0013B45A38|nr:MULTISPECIES: beta-3-deoxy-D-manno-oct-2-ulosonic acid transferase [Sphingomonas]